MALDDEFKDVELDAEAPGLASEEIQRIMHDLVFDVKELFDRVKKESNLSVDDFIRCSEQLRKVTQSLGNWLHQQKRTQLWEAAQSTQREQENAASLEEIYGLMERHQRDSVLLNQILEGKKSVEQVREELGIPANVTHISRKQVGG